jgi:hypothetical protein
MAVVNRILNILILLLAVVALVCGFALFNKRKQLRQHSDQVAQALEQVTGIIAPGTPLANEAKYDGGNGKLGFKQLGELDGVSSRIQKHAKDLVAQRNDLGTAVADIAVKFNVVPEAKPEDFQSLETYADKVKEVGDNVEAINQRNTQLIAKLADIGRTLGVEVTEEQLTSPESVGEVSTKIAEATLATQKRGERYAEALEGVARKLASDDMAVKPEQIKDPETFESALTQLDNGLSKVQEKLQRADNDQKRIAELEAKDKETLDKLTQERETAERLRLKTEDSEKQILWRDEEINRLKDIIAKFKDIGTGGGTLQGEVVEVNYDWQYAIINLGNKDGLPQNLTMTVGRDREFIANALVTRVYKDYAVVDILPEMKQGEVLQGDRVFFLASSAGAAPRAGGTELEPARGGDLIPAAPEATPAVPEPAAAPAELVPAPPPGDTLPETGN